jgi:hypothetical protein
MVEETDGQLELFTMRPAPHLAGPASDAWACTRTGQARLAELTTFAAARGWPEPTITAVAHAIAFVAVADVSGNLSPETVVELRRRRLPITRLREYLTSQHPNHDRPPALPILPPTSQRPSPRS